jgi:hypothetical protein
MLSKRQLVIGLLVPLLVFQVACHKQQAAAKPKVLGPKEAPTLTVTLPDEIQPEPLPDAPPETAKVQEPPPQPKKTRAHKKGSTSPSTQAKSGQPTATSPAPPPVAGGDTTTASIHPPPNPAEAAAAVAIGPDVSSPEAARDRQSTTQLLDTTEKELKGVDSKGLSSDQQAMLAQIRTYISQSRKAITDGDYERASNLAKKAQLLTDELMKK